MSRTDNLERLFDQIRSAMPLLDFERHPLISLLALIAAPSLLAIMANVLMRQLHKAPTDRTTHGGK
ncbi:hypothetical protein [Methylobacterium radiotolerans]|uniref:hypothetical protein n=1 Tax=Methylobacterium radiotolerans TaxID=31998 RepID=UPI0009754E6A|nr:hypothetical protein [Methylobacterium radiotolerans]ONF49425.1 hypothetical protein RSM1_09110 [Methylobacterium radiotolerans]